MPKERVKVIRSPILPGLVSCDDSMTYSNSVVYYVKLSNGLIATRPEDFPENSEKKKESKQRPNP